MLHSPNVVGVLCATDCCWDRLNFLLATGEPDWRFAFFGEEMASRSGVGVISRCDELREKGNVEYRQLSAGSCVFTPLVRRRKLTQAEQYYREALGYSRNESERAACLKNLGMLHVLWSKLEVADAVGEIDLASESSQQLAYGKKKVVAGVKFLLKALREGASANKPQAWLEHVQESLVGLVDWAVEVTYALHLPSAPLLRCLCTGFELALLENSVRCKAAVVAHLRLAKVLFQRGNLEVADDESEQRDFSKRLALMQDCLEVLRKARSLPANNVQSMVVDSLQQIEDLQERAENQVCVCESMQALHMGDKMLRKALNDSGSINMELALQAVDFYRSAAKLTQERDIESEAIAMSRLGRVFSEVIKDSARASKFHYQATMLALTSMSPRISRSSWYLYSSAKLAEHQAEVVRDEESEHEEQRASIKKKLEEDLRILDLEAEKGGHALLVYIYKKYPNPDPKKQPGDMLNGAVLTKEMLRRAIFHYHPDVNRMHGEERLVLCEEISKILNNKYECFKLERSSSQSSS